MMHRLVIASLAAAGASVGFGSAASAADLGRPAPVPVYTKAPVMAAPSWTGCYVGVEAGGVFGKQTVKDNDPGALFGAHVTNDIKPTGGLAGGTIGCNWQTGSWVFGAENDLSWAGLSGTQSDLAPNFNTAFGHSFKTTWLDTVRARVGFAAGPGLYYVTGGAAFTDINDSDVGPTAITSIKSTATGWTVGGGAEWMLPDPHWSVKAEYLYVDFGSRNDNFSALNPLDIDVRTHLNENIVRAGVNYRFW